MSYILEALKKADQQRHLGQVPGIASEHERRAGPVSRRWLWLMLLAVNALILLLLIVLWQRTSVVKVAAPEVVANAETSAVKPMPATPRVVKPEPWPETSERVIMPARPLDPGLAVTEKVVQPAPPAPEAPPNTAPRESAQLVEYPVWPQVPEHLLARLTNGLRLDVHVFSDVPENRFILVNLVKYREGETVQDGLVVQEITPRGAVLSLQGERFRLLAQ